MIWKCKNKKIEYGKNVLIMGILNVTPDSFSDGGKYLEADKAAKKAKELVFDGADIIDIGAQSTRPGHTVVSPEEEWSRLSGVLERLNGEISVAVSVDTYYPSVAEKALRNGADIINDVSGKVNPEMAKVVKNASCGWILVHNGHASPQDVKKFFEYAISECKKYEIDLESICFDMGIGFGKDYKEDLVLIKEIEKYKIKNFPLLFAASRKRVIGKGSREENPQSRIYGNIAADAMATAAGVDIIRLHDVKNEKHGIYMAEAIKNASKS